MILRHPADCFGRKSGWDRLQAVVSATAAYLEAEDAMAAWIDEKCERDPNAWSSSSDHFTSWSAWADVAGENIGAQKKLTLALEARSFPIKNATKARGPTGLRVVPEEPPPTSWQAR